MMWLWLVTAAPIIPDATSGMQLTVDLKVILQTAIAGLLVWSLNLVRDSRKKLAATKTTIAVMEEQLKTINKTLDRIEKRDKKEPSV